MPHLPSDGTVVLAITYSSEEYKRDAEPVMGTLETRPSPFGGLPQCWVDGIQVSPESVRPIAADGPVVAPDDSDGPAPA